MVASDLVSSAESVNHKDREQRDREHFDSIASSYTRKDEAASSRVARRFRLEATVGAVESQTVRRVLEVGCGAGYAVDYLGDGFDEYLGVDHSAALVAIANERHGREGVEFAAGRVQELGLAGGFDLVVVIGVLHHLDDVDTAVAEMVRSLKPGGWVAVNEPQPHNPIIRILRRVRKRVDKTYADDQVEFSPSELVEMFERHGLVDVETRPQGYLSTPFAEVPLPVGAVTARLAAVAVSVDRWLGNRRSLQRLAWNSVAVGRKP
jgi:ubiquinone/menaquinone biosynthesis C-methylase UbiE